MKTIYTAFGLQIESEFPLPELLQSTTYSTNQIDVKIEQTILTSLWEECAGDDQYFFIKEDYVLFRIPEVGIFLIQNGNEIFVSPIGEVQEDQLRLYILGTCMGAILMQRKILPLHGSALVIDGKAYAIVGNSGAGKSTLASAFLKRGYKLLSDDVIPVTLNEKGVPVITPAYPQQKLWIESLDQFGMTSEGYRPIVDRETKFAIPVRDQFSSEITQLAGVIELLKTENDDIEFKLVQGLESLHTLFSHTYRNFFITPAGLLEWHFQLTAKMVNQLEMFQLQRPINRFTAHELTELILSTVRKEEKVV
ncbi:aldolase [Halalkalibacter alkalisediminis]|uniref:Aldolase n=1 Tax=Halalkalibacter alkalisediminis TaxID=935616 RepID=A0ABV6NH40_9BACI|nr:aldolase [Halalkalibacter alkalisediminis]